jgi:polysaccharide deacetylase 2 family uncharacterized protein YibQ
MPPKKKIKDNVSRSFKLPNKFKMFLSSFSMPAFVLTLAIGTTAIFGASFALYKTAAGPNYEAWPYVEIRIATILDETLDTAQPTAQATDTQTPAEHGDITTSTAHEQQHDTNAVTHSTAEYGIEDDNAYKVKLSHDETLYSTIDNGITVPRRNKEQTVFSAYKAPLFEALKTRAYKGTVSLVMVDYGLSDKITAQAARAFKDLHITYALSPYALTPQEKIDSARKNGHEVWLTLPLQAKHFPWNETGPMTLLIKSKANENRRRLIWLLSLAKGYTGLMDVQDSYFTTSESELNSLFSALHEHGVAYITSDDTDAEVIESMARGAKVPFSQNNLWLTKTGRMDELDKNLKALEKMATEQIDQSSVTAFFPAYPNVIARIAQWADQSAKQQGIIFVPASYNMSEYK